MLGCGGGCSWRSVLRGHRILKFTNSRVPFQVSCRYTSLTRRDPMGDSKKQKRLRRAISNATQGHAQSSTPAYVSSTQDLLDTEAVHQVFDVTLTSRTSRDKDGGTFNKEPLISAEKHSLSLEVGASLFRFIRGKVGSTQKNIEEEMGVKISFPSSKKEDNIILEGVSVDSVTRASQKIQALIDEAVRSPNLDYSHFVSLPLALHPELVDKLIKFQNSILDNSSAKDEDDLRKAEDLVLLSNEGSNVAAKLNEGIPLVSYQHKATKSPTAYELGIEKSIFIKPKTFHLTVLMLKLWNKDRVDAASNVLKSISSEVMDALDGRPVSVKLKGLDCMRGSLAKARVLYAPVEEVGDEGRLLRACQVIIKAYVDAGLVLEKDAKEKLKLHATLMNARHRKSKSRSRKLDWFDAQGIFKQFGSEEWGEYLIPEAHLSQRFTFDESGYYHCCASIPFHPH